MDRVADPIAMPVRTSVSRGEIVAFAVLLAVLIFAPALVYPMSLMKSLCFALFACAFNLLLGYVGLLSFGHALFFGWARYVFAHAAKFWGLTPEVAILLGMLTGTAFGSIVGA